MGRDAASGVSRGDRGGRATRERLIATCIALVASEGFAAATTSAIAAGVAAGVAEGTIYRHFASKEQLLEDGRAQGLLEPLADDLMT